MRMILCLQTGSNAVQRNQSKISEWPGRRRGWIELTCMWFEWYFAPRGQPIVSVWWSSSLYQAADFPSFPRTRFHTPGIQCTNLSISICPAAVSVAGRSGWWSSDSSNSSASDARIESTKLPDYLDCVAVLQGTLRTVDNLAISVVEPRTQIDWCCRCQHRHQLSNLWAKVKIRHRRPHRHRRHCCCCHRTSIRGFRTAVIRCCRGSNTWKLYQHWAAGLQRQPMTWSHCSNCCRHPDTNHRLAIDMIGDSVSWPRDSVWTPWNWYFCCSSVACDNCDPYFVLCPPEKVRAVHKFAVAEAVAAAAGVGYYGLAYG